MEATVADYLSMLSLELRAQPYGKTAHRQALKRLLHNRSDSAIERKHQNISAVLIEIGFPYIAGYKPLRNYQRLLLEVVADRLVADDSLKPLAHSVATEPVIPPRVRPDHLPLVDPPAAQHRNVAHAPQADYLPRGRLGVDFLALEARNASLGKAGEQVVFDSEVARLRHLGKQKLADRVEWVSATRGDGLGFDVLSFEPSGKERFIEVKTTAFGKETPFYVTRTELQFSTGHAREFHLYRLFEFRKSPRMFLLNGRLDQTCILDPEQFIARAA